MLKYYFKYVNFIKTSLCGTNILELRELNRFGENQYLKNFPFKVHLQKLVPGKKVFISH